MIYLFFARREVKSLRITQFSNYAIRVLMYSALKGPRASAVPEIAKAYGASYNHMKKVAAELCRLGYLETVRGRIGGVRLTKDPTEIRIGDVIRGTEGEVVLVECFDPPTNTSLLIPVCELKGALHEALAAFFEGSMTTHSMIQSGPRTVFRGSWGSTSGRRVYVRAADGERKSALR